MDYLWHIPVQVPTAYKILALLPDENYDMHFKKFIVSLEQLSKRYVSEIGATSMGLRKGHYQSSVQ
jgi:hypothetical protein